MIPTLEVLNFVGLYCAMYIKICRFIGYIPCCTYVILTLEDLNFVGLYCVIYIKVCRLIKL